MVQTVDWWPRNKCKIVLLCERDYVCGEVGRQICGNLTKYGISKFLIRYKEGSVPTNKTLKTGKETHQQVMVKVCETETIWQNKITRVYARLNGTMQCEVWVQGLFRIDWKNLV